MDIHMSNVAIVWLSVSLIIYILVRYVSEKQA